VWVWVPVWVCSMMMIYVYIYIYIYVCVRDVRGQAAQAVLVSTLHLASSTIKQPSPGVYFWYVISRFRDGGIL